MFQHGGSFINFKEAKLGGNTISEFNKPELVTVTPLSNPIDINDKTIRLSPTVGSKRQKQNSNEQ